MSKYYRFHDKQLPWQPQMHGQPLYNGVPLTPPCVAESDLKQASVSALSRTQPNVPVILGRARLG